MTGRNPYRIVPAFFGAPTQVAFFRPKESRAGLPPGFLSSEPGVWTWSFPGGRFEHSQVKLSDSEFRIRPVSPTSKSKLPTLRFWRMKLRGRLFASRVPPEGTNSDFRPNPNFST